MERRFKVRKQEILKEADIKPQVVNGMLKRLEQFAKPFIETFGRREPKENARMYMCGLLSDLERKNIESIAYRYDKDRRALQNFIGTAPWDEQPLQQELVRQVGTEIGQEDGGSVFDNTGNKKCGNGSGSRMRQWIQRIDKVQNGLAGIIIRYSHLLRYGF